MNLDDLTIGQAKALAVMFGGSVAAPVSPHVGKPCIVRTTTAGVHFGTLVSQVGQTVELKDARRLWRFDVAPHGISLSDVAVHGSPGARSKITAAVAAVTLLDAIEVIPTTPTASDQLSSAPVAKP